MWLRRQLVALFDLEERSAHTPDEVDWESAAGGLRPPAALATHPRLRPDARTARLPRRRPLPASTRRSDLDPSLLGARARDGALARRRARRRALIIGVEPSSHAFWKYATGRRARALIDVSPQWWKHGVVAIRYEDLVAEPGGRAAAYRRRPRRRAGAGSRSRHRAVTFGALKSETVKPALLAGAAEPLARAAARSSSRPTLRAPTRA